MAQNIYRVDWRHKGGRYHDRVLFFFQAEDGIRDLTVTGVQTCALPIYLLGGRVSAHHDEELGRSRHGHGTQDTFVRPMRIFSGIQPTGEKHLGNYIGAIRHYVASQDEGEAFICIVDLHSVTVAYDPEDLRESTLSLAALLIASGLNPDRCTLFVQSHNQDHPAAAWLLSSVTSFGELRRMTQFKEKAEQQEFASVALFTYPVLHAADILP